MSSRDECLVVRLTPPGRGAVATLLAVGPQATAAVDALFHSASGRRLSAEPPGKILFGRWRHAAEGEEIVVCRREAERVEIHCHGGHAAAAAILADLIERGARELSWREWLTRAGADPLSAAATIALAHAPTERTAGILWDQAQGALRGALEELDSLMAEQQVQEAGAKLDALLRFAALGRHLVEPWKVVLCGRPNVGKSSLINALVGFERAIVHATPGTTRDVVTAAAALDGWPVELADTAGWRDVAEPLEAAGIALAQERLAQADLVVLVFDASSPPCPEDQALAHAWPDSLRVWNKVDLPGAGPLQIGPRDLLVSAVTRQGLAQLEQAIAARLVPQAPAAGQAVPFSAEQVAALHRVQAALGAGDCQQARDELAALRRPIAGAC